ncbi:hypothetical protein IV102_10340 [bacterium]|nr:hypothetical protein [bacterium]
MSVKVSYHKITDIETYRVTCTAEADDGFAVAKASVSFKGNVKEFKVPEDCVSYSNYVDFKSGEGHHEIQAVMVDSAGRRSVAVDNTI